MGKILRIDGGGFVGAWDTSGPGSIAGFDEAWLTVSIRWRSTTQAFAEHNVAGMLSAALWDETAGEELLNVIDAYDPDHRWAVLTGNPDYLQESIEEPAITANRWFIVEIHVDRNIIKEAWVDDEEIVSIPATNGKVQNIYLSGGLGDDTPVYFDDVKLGSTRGADDLFSDDFESGTLAAWILQGGDVSVVGEDEELVAAHVQTRGLQPPLWRVFVTNRASRTVTLLDVRSTDRTFLFKLNEAAQHTGLVASDDPEIYLPFLSAGGADEWSPALVTTNRRLVFGFRREGGTPPWKVRFGGILMQTEDVGADAPTSRYTALDPWAYMFSRPVRNAAGALPTGRGLVYTDTPPSEIVTDLLTRTETVDGETHILYDASLVQESDVLLGDFILEPGLSVGEAWRRLCDTGYVDIVLRPIYEPLTDPGKVCELVVRKRAGSLKAEVVFNWDTKVKTVQFPRGSGGQLADLSRLVDGTRLVNRMQFYAGQGGDPVDLLSDAASISTYGEYWGLQFFVSGRGQENLVEALAEAEVLAREGGERTLVFTPAADWSPMSLRDWGLGDYIAVWASRRFREPIGIDYDGFYADYPGAAGYQRVYAIPIRVDDNGSERVEGVVTSLDTALGG